MQPSGTYYFVNTFLTLKNESISLEDRHRLALYAWSCEKVFMPPNKRKQLIDWVQNAILKEPSLELWLTFKHFLANLTKIDKLDDFVPHSKLATAFKTALESECIKMVECSIECLKMCSPQALSRMPVQTLHCILLKLHCFGGYNDLVDRIVRRVYIRATNEKELEILVKRFSDLPDELDEIQLKYILCHRVESVLGILFKHNSRLIPLMCYYKSNLIPKAANTAATKSKQTVEWWKVFLSLSAKVKVSPQMTDIIRAVIAYPELGSLAVQVNSHVYHSLPAELQSDDKVQKEFIINSDDVTIDQLVTMTGMFVGPLSKEALALRAGQSDKMAVIQAMEKCKPELLESLLCNANLTNVSFVPSIRDRILRILEPTLVNNPSVLLTRICMMLNSKMKFEEFPSVEDSEEYLKLWSQATISKQEILNRVLCFVNDNVRSKIISDYAKQSGDQFRLDSFDHLEDVVLFLKKFLHKAQLNACHIRVIDEVSYCLLPAKISFKILNKSFPLLTKECVVRLARSALVDHSHVCEVVDLMCKSEVDPLTIAELLSHCVSHPLLTPIGKILQVEAMLPTIALSASKLSSDEINEHFSRLAENNSADSLRKSLLNLAIHVGGHNNLSSFLNKLDPRFQRCLTDQSLDLFLRAKQTRLDHGLLNNRLIEECLQNNSPDVHLIRLLTGQHQSGLRLPAKQSLLCALPKFDVGLIVQVLRIFEETWRLMPSAVCMACVPAIILLISAGSYQDAHRVTSTLVQVMRDPSEPPNATVPLAMTLLHVITYCFQMSTYKDVRSIIFSLMAKSERTLLAHAVSCAYGLNKNKEIAQTINQLYSEFKDTGRYDLKV